MKVSEFTKLLSRAQCMYNSISSAGKVILTDKRSGEASLVISTGSPLAYI